VITLAGCAVYSLHFSAENVFFAGIARLQDDRARALERVHAHKVVVIGGSSTLFSIDGEQLLSQFRLPVVNMGLAAGLGAQVIVERVLEHVRAGDTLILALEPNLLADYVEPTDQGIQLSLVLHHPEWVSAPVLGGTSVSTLSVLLALRPGGYRAFTILGKLLTGRPIFRYLLTDASPGGLMHTKVRQPLPVFPEHAPRPSQEGRRLLAALRDWSLLHGVRIAYSLPWSYMPEPLRMKAQLENAQVLLDITEYMPVLHDPLLGADSEAGHFADTIWHLDEIGSALRTAELGREIRDWQTWQPQQLREVIGELSAKSAQRDRPPGPP
jgi:hypothetical protein